MKSSGKDKAKARTSTTTTSHSTSVPSLPDVHQAPPSGRQGSFLHTLLTEEGPYGGQLEGEEEGEEVGAGSVLQHGEGWINNTGGDNHSRSVVAKLKGKVAEEEGGGECMTTSDLSYRNLSGETVTARAEKILTASWSGAGDAASSRQRGQQRRHSRDSGTSGQRLSGPLLSKKKFKQRLNHGYDSKQFTASQRRFSSPATSLSNVSSTKAAEFSLKREADSATPSKLETVSDSMRHPDPEGSLSESAKCSSHLATNLSASVKPTSEPTKILPDSDSERLTSTFTNVPSESEKPFDSTKMLSNFQRPASNSGKTSSDPKRQSVETLTLASSQRTASIPATSVTKGRYADSQTIPIIPEHVPETARTSNSPAWTSTPRANPPSAGTKTPPLFDPFNQWTTCRALDDESDDDNDEGDEGLRNSGTSEAGTQELYTIGPDSSMGDGRLSRAVSSSNPGRRKRPLLLPPIMLPPIYTVKPTPLRLRDEVYFAGAASRARRPISDKEWDKLKDCRYLRIRTLRRPIKV